MEFLSELRSENEKVSGMTTTELIELLQKNERGGATGRPREVMFEVGDRIINTDRIDVIGSGDGLISELYISLPSSQPEPDTALYCDGFTDGYKQGQKDAQPDIIRCNDCMHNGSFDTDCPIEWNGKEYCSFAERLGDDSD